MASTIPYLVSSNLVKRSSIILPQLSSKPTLHRWLSTSPPEYSPGSPPEFPDPGQVQEPMIPTAPPEWPDISPDGPEIDPGSTPDEIGHTWPDEGVGLPPLCPEPVPLPGPDSPVPPLHPPRPRPDTLPPPSGPDVLPPDRLPRDPPPGVPPVPPLDPPGPTIVL